MFRTTERIGFSACFGLISACFLGVCLADARGDEALFARLRQDMVREQLAARDIKDQRVLDIMGRVPRHLFVPPNSGIKPIATIPFR